MQVRKCHVVTLMVMIQIVSLLPPITFLFIQGSQAAEYSSRKPILKPNEDKKIEEMEKGREIGSKPPSCEKKCYGCEPCEAVQVPTTSSIPLLSLHYANYQPECWRCHCPT